MKPTCSFSHGLPARPHGQPLHSDRLPLRSVPGQVRGGASPFSSGRSGVECGACRRWASAPNRESCPLSLHTRTKSDHTGPAGKCQYRVHWGRIRDDATRCCRSVTTPGDQSMTMQESRGLIGSDLPVVVPSGCIIRISIARRGRRHRFEATTCLGRPGRDVVGTCLSARLVFRPLLTKISRRPQG